MRRLQRVRQPSAALAKTLRSSSSLPLCKATAATSRCLAARPRDFSTTPSSTFHASRAWAAEKEKDAELPSEIATESQPTASTPEEQLLAASADEGKTTAEAPLSEASTEAQAPQVAPQDQPLVEPVTEGISTEPEATAAAPESHVPIDTADEGRTTTENITPSSATEVELYAAATPEPRDDALAELIATHNPTDMEAVDAHEYLDTDPTQQPTWSTEEDTDFKLPSAKRVVAQHADEIGEADGYQPAQTTAGLPVIGGLEKWFKKPPTEKKQAKKEDNFGVRRFQAFASIRATPISHAATLKLCVHRAVLEALAVQAVGRPGLLLASWRALHGWNRALGLSLGVDAHGQVELLGNVSAVVRELVNGQEGHERMKEEAEVQAILEQPHVVKTHHDMKAIELDATLKFAIAKRVYQLTGRAIPDAKLVDVKTVGNLIATLVKPPRPRTVYEAVERRGALTSLPNVTVHKKRRTPVDKAVDLGSWKEMKKELIKRGLPVLSRTSYRDNKFRPGEGATDRELDSFRQGQWYHGPQPAAKDKKKGRRKD